LEQGKYHEALIPIQDAFATDVGREYLSNMVSSNYKKHAVGKDDRRPAVLQDLELLAAIQYGLGNLSVAQKLLQEVRSVARDIYGDMEHPLIARSLVALAKIRQISGDYVEAHSMLSQGLDMQVLPCFACYHSTLF
jgi:tetratricopeptide (TPR) repeat protein